MKMMLKRCLYSLIPSFNNKKSRNHKRWKKNWNKGNLHLQIVRVSLRWKDKAQKVENFDKKFLKKQKFHERETSPTNTRFWNQSNYAEYCNFTSLGSKKSERIMKIVWETAQISH